MLPLFSRFCILPLLVLLLGCDRSGGRVNAPAISPPEMAKSVLAEFDANHNGALDSDELSQCPGLKSSLSLSDADRDGKLTAEELAGRFQSFLGARIGLVGVNAKVTLDGKP